MTHQQSSNDGGEAKRGCGSGDDNKALVKWETFLL